MKKSMLSSPASLRCHMVPQTIWYKVSGTYSDPFFFRTYMTNNSKYLASCSLLSIVIRHGMAGNWPSLISCFFYLVQLSHCLMHHRVSFIVFSGTEDLQTFSISSGIGKAYLVEVCIKLGEALVIAMCS